MISFVLCFISLAIIEDSNRIDLYCRIVFCNYFAEVVVTLLNINRFTDVECSWWEWVTKSVQRNCSAQVRVHGCIADGASQSGSFAFVITSFSSRQRPVICQTHFTADHEMVPKVDAAKAGCDAEEIIVSAWSKVEYFWRETEVMFWAWYGRLPRSYTSWRETEGQASVTWKWSETLAFKTAENWAISSNDCVVTCWKQLY